MNELKGRIRGRREIEKGWGKETGNRDRREKSCNAKGTKGKVDEIREEKDNGERNKEERRSLGVGSRKENMS